MENEGISDPSWSRAIAWIESQLGGKVVHSRSQGRWRAAWYFELERNGETLPMYFRGHRPGIGTSLYPLEQEMNIFRILESHDLPVPHMYGLCPDPEGIVMERSPGRPNLALADSQSERESVLDQYVDALVVMHGIDPQEFEAIGMSRPRGPEGLAFGDLALWEASYRKQKCRPEPLIEFVTRWLKQNVPIGRSKVSFLHADAGQFIFENGKLTALLDFELSYLGDPAADLAGLRTRDISEPLGDLRRAYRRYEQKTGSEIDLRVVDYHTIRFSLMTPMSTARVCAAPPPRLNLPQYLGWYLVYGRLPVELIAKLEGVELETPVVPDPVSVRYDSGHAVLTSILDGLMESAKDAAVRYELDTAMRIATHLKHIQEMGQSVAEDDMTDVTKVLGYRPRNWQEADAQLEELILSAPAERNEDILRYLYKHTVRQQALLGSALREMEGAVLQTLE